MPPEFLLPATWSLWGWCAPLRGMCLTPIAFATRPQPCCHGQWRGYAACGVDRLTCGSGLARDPGDAILQLQRGDAIASKPAPTEKACVASIASPRKT
ncbi:hypothetical protein C7A07_19970 [Pseudomonas fragi]|nr:hypothetical protein [Pseudomonas fragi]PRW96746.1 hypothetical protein C7A07_19970 [Pseudomonas fragi]